MTPVLSVDALGDGDTTLCRVDGVELLLCGVEGRYYALAAWRSIVPASRADGIVYNAFTARGVYRRWVAAAACVYLRPFFAAAGVFDD